jgi:hypothetical protein
MTVLPDSAFEGCERLEVAFLSEGVIEPWNCTYRGCKSLLVIDLPPSLLQFPAGAFRECPLVGAGVNKARVISYRTFMHFDSWVNLGFGDSIEELGGDAFTGCTALKGVRFGRGVARLGKRAFMGCSSLGSLNLPAPCQSAKVAVAAFKVCVALARVGFGAGPVEVEAFAVCVNLVRVECRSSLAALGRQAFLSCSGPVSLELGGGSGGPLAIGASAFVSCSALRNVTLLPCRRDRARRVGVPRLPA